jgi:hypothetical protein
MSISTIDVIMNTCIDEAEVLADQADYFFMDRSMRVVSTLVRFSSSISQAYI